MEVLTIAQEMIKIIDRIKDEGKLSVPLIESKAKTAREYDKAIAVRTTALKAAGEPVTIIKDKARGDACEALYAKIVAEESLKAHWERLKYLQAQLNGYQSINRHLDST